MRRTKIICTLGPASSSYKVLRGLVKAGMNIARLNFSHGTHTEHLSRINTIRRVQKEEGVYIPILADLGGPKIRVGVLEKNLLLETGKSVTIYCGRKKARKETSGEYIPIPCKELCRQVHKGSAIFLDDGTIKLKVNKVEGRRIICKIDEGGILESRKSVNVPGISMGLRFPTEKDREDLKFAQANGVDFIGVSFVRNDRDLIKIRKLLRGRGREIPLIAKIELPEAVRDIDQIIEEADGVMIARGDLGVEMPTEEIPLIQKEIVKKCRKNAKPVIIATQMLESMVENVLPTRAEASDVANAIFDGSDILMLSSETSVGRDPVRALSTMVRIITKTEGAIDYGMEMGKNVVRGASTIASAISRAACESADSLKACAIIVPTFSGSTARLVSSLRPPVPIYAITHNRRLLPYLDLLWGTKPFIVSEAKTTDRMIESSVDIAKKEAGLKKGDIAVITAGIPLNVPGTTNLIKIEQI